MIKRAKLATDLKKMILSPAHAGLWGGRYGSPLYSAARFTGLRILNNFSKIFYTLNQKAKGKQSQLVVGTRF